MKKVNLCEFSDLLFCAEKLGYEWNRAHGILDDDEIRPMYEMNSKEFDLREINEFGYSEDTIKILKAFFKQEEVTEFTLVND